jgi:hypothetical protein
MTIIVPRKRHRNPPKKNQTGNFVGIVLILIAIAIIAVVVHFTLNMKRSADGSAESVAGSNTQASGGSQNPRAQSDPDVIFPSKAAIEGKWALSVGVAKSEMTIVGDMFQIIAIQDEKGEVRRYTRGFYEYDEKTGKLTLKPDDRAGEPDAIKGVIYKMMTSRPFDIYVSKKKMTKELFWAPPQDMIESRQIHPLFYYMVTDGPLVLKWTKLEVPTEAIKKR